MVSLSVTPARRLLLLLLASTVVLSLDTANTHQDAPSYDIDQYDDPTRLHDSLNYVADDDAAKLTLDRRFDIPGTDIDLDTLADDVYGKVTSKVEGAIDDAKQGLNETIEAAKDGVGEAIDAAKGVLEDIKNSVEDLYQKVKDKVAEIEKELGDAVKNWVWEHIGKPLVTVLVILLCPFALLFLWWLLYHVAKPFVAADRRRQRRHHQHAAGTQFEMQPTGGSYTHTEPEPRPRGVGARAAALVVSSWERLGQGMICLLCPWYGSFALWRDRNRTNKRLEELEKFQDEVQGLLRARKR
ncbi:hypothetical protein F5X96DRAFT_178112 [Biscogniauxia mediterranea]|nr:hypothetical protein F5X96DRAFT_178112 [Biscogniauxia mediterranea]